jgi:phenylalanyl-tRNA synthetase beta chain
VGDVVAVALPGAVLPGPFAITSRKTYGHISDGMICSARERGLGEDHTGILVLSRLGLNPEVGENLIPLLHLDEEVVEVNVTPDRGYCFSIRGIAREFSHATGEPFTDPALISAPAAAAGGFAVELDDAAPIAGKPGCDRFGLRIVRGCAAAGPSPSWMQRRLEQAGMRPISLAVDVTNYVMLELGQPLHAYDLAEVAEPIVVRRAQAGERLVTLDGVDRALDAEDLLITDSPDGRSSRVLGLAGVMGGASSEVSATTHDVLIEAAHFEPVSVARTSRRHKLGSEAAKRFERGVDPELPPKAIQRVVDLLVEFGGGEPDTVWTDAGQPGPPEVIRFDPSYPERLVGVAYGPAKVAEVLELIGCAVDQSDKASWLVTPPSWRPDLTRAVDLVEEVARIAGYDTIASVLPAAPAGPGLTKSQRLRRSVARALADYGLVEVLSYPFVGSGVFDTLGYARADQRRQAVRLANPLDAAAPLMRTAVLQTLLVAARRNVGRGATDVGLFESGLVTEAPAEARIAPIYPVDRRPAPDQLETLFEAVPDQPRHVAGVLMGARQYTGVWGSGRPADWTDAVEAGRLIGRTVGLEVQPVQATSAPYHPGRCAALTVQGITVGHAGELDPRVVAAFGLPERAVAFEVDLDQLIALAPDLIRAQPLSTQPLAKEDLAFVVRQDLPAGELVAAARHALGSLAEAVSVFDVYTGDQIPQGMKSVALAVRLRAADHTLTSAEIGAARQAVIDQVASAFGAELRA